MYNWSFYIDDNADDTPETSLLADFTEETGYPVDYDTFESVDDVWARISTGASGYDLAVLVDYRVREAIPLGLLIAIDDAKIPNTQFLSDQFGAPAYDPTLSYSRPYFWGTTGIGYDSTVASMTGWAQMFDTAGFLPAHNGRVSMLNDQRETIGAALKFLGYSLNSEEPSQLEEARTVLLGQKPFLAQYGGAAVYMPNLTSGAWDASHAYNGDIVTAQETNQDLVYIVPAEGAVMWVDNMVIPRGARNIEAAHEFMDFILEPEHQIRNALSAGYPSPSKVATDYLPDEFKADPAIYPPPEILANLEIVGSLSPAANALYDDIWTDVQG
jgi:spermidine/putrescine transport system substrate-binding protein